MAVSGNFDRLVSGLSLDERQNLLEKLKGQSGISDEPLYIEDDAAAFAADFETEYSRLPWYYRLWYVILSLFKARPPLKIFEDHEIAVLGQKIEEKSPGFYDYQKVLLLPPFYRQVERLKEAARFFYSALDSSVNRDKGAFFAFLGSLEMPDVHKQLESGTEPVRIVERQPGLPDTELRQTAFRAMDDALTMVHDEYRNTMYAAARSLNCLKELSSFLYDRLVMAFAFNSSVNGETCSAGVVRELLVSLSKILYSLRIVPPMTLLESLFVFVLQERSAEPGFDINREIRGLLARAEDSLSVVREFNKQVPLTWIIRCSTRNMSYAPKDIPGGEEWFVVYRDYWKRHIESLYAGFIKDRRHKELLNSFRYFLKGRSLKMLVNVQSESNPDGLPVRGSFALAFLLTFYQIVFMTEINKILRPILIDGDFHRKENRMEFAESYNTLIKLEDDIKKIELEISPSGDYGKRYAQARQDMSSLPVKRRKIQLVLEDASLDAKKIIDDVREASINMTGLLNGILGKDTRGKYDVLNNLAKLSGNDSLFTEGLSETGQKFQTIVKILDDIEAMESGR